LNHRRGCSHDLDLRGAIEQAEETHL
jgi:hypothetical protein